MYRNAEGYTDPTAGAVYSAIQREERRKEIKMNTNTRLKASDSILEIAMKMSDGNPSALQVIMTLLQDSTGMGFAEILTIDSIGLYGSKLYMLWNDCCDRDMDKVKSVLYARMRGKLTDWEIMEHVAGIRGTPFDDLFQEGAQGHE